MAHEFGHAIVSNRDIVGSRAGHGVIYFHRMMRDVVWYATNIPMIEKFKMIAEEFTYSCSIGMYKIVDRIFRSQSTVIALETDYFTIDDLISDGRDDIVELGQWFWEILSPYLQDRTDRKQEYMRTPIYDLLKSAIKTIKEDENLGEGFDKKPLRR
ncbi:MAG: hypothetical protein LBC44_03540 [Mycoplasmataceae bacterium]|nr:hypothetical protein [Mycoplasmataceae bacterium]